MVAAARAEAALSDRDLRRFLARRAAALLPTFFGITLITFIGLRLVPGDAADAAAGAGGDGAQGQLSAEARGELRRLYGLDRPLPVQYAAWVSRLVRLDLGTSWRDGRPVMEKIAERLPTTLLLTLLASLLAYAIAVPLGVLAAARAGTRVDRGVGAVLLVAASVPSYWLASLGIVFLGGGAYLDWFPILGLASAGAESWPLLPRLLDRAWHLVLPVGCLALGGLAAVSRVVRAAVLDALGQDYIRTARAKGLGGASVLWRHGVRTALLPMITLASALFPALLGGSAIIETVFAIPGMGLLGYEAIGARDYPVILAVVSLAGLITMVGLALTDVAYRLCDPRVTFGRADT